MNRKIFILLLILMSSAPLWAGTQAAATPSSVPVPSLGEATPTPKVIPPLLKVPEGLKPAMVATPFPQKPSPWLSLTAIGAGIPWSSNLKSAYGTAFTLELGAGFKASDQWTFWLDLSLGLYGSKNETLSEGNNFTLIQAAFWARYRILDSDLSPYLLAGPGLAYNENRSDNQELYDPSTGYGYIPVNAYEVDFLAEGGVGLDLRMGDGASVFLQTKLTFDFASGHFASFASTDSPDVVEPVEAGIIVGI